MSERPTAVFFGLVAGALAFAAVVVWALISLGASGVAAAGATLVGALTACVFFVSELDRLPLTALLLSGLALASMASLIRTLWAYWRERRLLAQLPVEPARDQVLARVARAADIDLRITPARRVAAFSYGLLRPRVVVTSGLVERLTPQQLEAVLWHEAEHVHSREPLRCLLARLAANAFFWAPLLRGLLDRFLLVKEIAADRRAIAKTSVSALAGALYEVSSERSLAYVGAGDFAVARVERLFASTGRLPSLFRSWELLVTAASSIALALVLLFPAQVEMGGHTSLQSMITSWSFHGLPGMAVGFAVNVAMLYGGRILYRRFIQRTSVR